MGSASEETIGIFEDHECCTHCCVTVWVKGLDAHDPIKLLAPRSHTVGDLAAYIKAKLMNEGAAEFETLSVDIKKSSRLNFDQSIDAVFASHAKDNVLRLNIHVNKRENNGVDVSGAASLLAAHSDVAFKENDLKKWEDVQTTIPIACHRYRMQGDPNVYMYGVPYDAHVGEILDALKQKHLDRCSKEDRMNFPIRCTKCQRGDGPAVYMPCEKKLRKFYDGSIVRLCLFSTVQPLVPKSANLRVEEGRKSPSPYVCAVFNGCRFEFDTWTNAAPTFEDLIIAIVGEEAFTRGQPRWQVTIIVDNNKRVRVDVESMGDFLFQWRDGHSTKAGQLIIEIFEDAQVSVSQGEDRAPLRHRLVGEGGDHAPLRRRLAGGGEDPVPLQAEAWRLGATTADTGCHPHAKPDANPNEHFDPNQE